MVYPILSTFIYISFSRGERVNEGHLRELQDRTKSLSKAEIFMILHLACVVHSLKIQCKNIQCDSIHLEVMTEGTVLPGVPRP
jgi:hypothetical protein